MDEVVCLLRLETNAAQQAYQLTVKTGHAELTAAIKQAVVAQLA